MSRFKSKVRKLHLWIALMLAPIYIFMAISGTVLVIDHKLDELLNPGLLLSKGSGVHKPLDEILDAAIEANPGAGVPIQLRFPRIENGVYLIFFRPPNTSSSLEVYIDPYDASFLGKRIWGKYTMSFIYHLHYNLMMGDVGKIFLGICAIFLISSVVSGLYLWTPKSVSRLLMSMRIRVGKSRYIFYYDAHKNVGLYCSIVILVLAISGFTMVLPKFTKSVIGYKEVEEYKSQPKPDGVKITLDDACKIALSRFPGATPKRIFLPKKENSSLGVMLSQSNEVVRTMVWMDRFSGAILGIQDPRDVPKNHRALAWMFPLHSGQAFGPLGRSIIALAGLGTAFLCCSGFILWWKKKRRTRL